MVDQEAIVAKIKDKLGPDTEISIVDVSDGCGAKYESTIISAKFEGLPMLQRHRLVLNDTLGDEMKRIHSFRLKAYTPAEQAARLKK